jgi:N-acetyl-anhydromuramyl-L-alanine amidase AmpD
MWLAEGPESLNIEVHVTSDANQDSERIVRGAVIHYTDGSWDSSLSWLTASDATKVSCHYLIGRDGRMAQLCRIDRVAYHAGKNWDYLNPNKWTVGYELVATAADGYTFTEKQYIVLKQHLDWLFQLKGLTKQFPNGDPSTCHSKEYWKYWFLKSNGFIAGHSAFNSNKPDPGKNFDWSRII